MIVSEFKENNSSRFDEQFLELLPDFCYEDGWSLECRDNLGIFEGF